MFKSNYFNKQKSIFILLSSIGLSNIGAWIYFIALNLIILDTASSAFAVSILYILKPLATLFTNFWSGSMIDRINKRKIMITLDIIRGLLIIILPLISSLWFLYIIVFFINMAGEIFYQASMIYMTKFVPEGKRQRFNSFRSLVGSGAFVIGPSVAGLLFMMGSPAFAIIINGMTLILSGVLTFFLPNIEKEEKQGFSNTKFGFKILRKDWHLVITYCKSQMKMVYIFILFYFIIIMTTTVDSLEVAFSKEVLNLSNTKYGFLVSIAGVGFVIGSVVNSVFANRCDSSKLIGYGSIFLSFGYLIYSFSNEFKIASLGFFLLSFALSFANTGFDTYYQKQIPVEIMGRVGSLFGILQAFFIIIFTILFGSLTNSISLQKIVIGASIFLFLISVILLLMILFFAEKRLIKTRMTYFPKKKNYL
ncbi:MFS transporter [Bacillus sp. OAE603]|uniref:MFS transporter n=1 Tax=Gottfriedia sp. OAE603 TaxID=2663872 RepID=UPI0017890306